MSLQKLQQMIDSKKRFSYRNQTAVIKRFENIHGQIEITIDINEHEQVFIKENEGKLGLFLDCFQEIKEGDVSIQSTGIIAQGKNTDKFLPDLYIESKQNFKTLTDMLMSDIEKVRTDPSYVNQAKQVCNNVSAIVNIARLQLQLQQKS